MVVYKTKLTEKKKKKNSFYLEIRKSRYSFQWWSLAQFSVPSVVLEDAEDVEFDQRNRSIESLHRLLRCCVPKSEELSILVAGNMLPRFLHASRSLSLPPMCLVLLWGLAQKYTSYEICDNLQVSTDVSLCYDCAIWYQLPLPKITFCMSCHPLQYLYQSADLQVWLLF